MKETDDDELQQWLENNLSLPEDPILREKAEAYRMLFEILDDEPANGLPYDFTAKVSRRIQADEKRHTEFKYNLLAAVIFIMALAAACSLMTIFSPTLFATLLKFKWTIIIGPVIFMVIQYLDLKLVKSNIFRS